MKNKKSNLVGLIVILMVGIWFIVIGAGSYFTRNNIVGLVQLAGGLFITGIGIYRLMNSSGKK